MPNSKPRDSPTRFFTSNFYFSNLLGPLTNGLNNQNWRYLNLLVSGSGRKKRKKTGGRKSRLTRKAKNCRVPSSVGSSSLLSFRELKSLFGLSVHGIGNHVWQKCVPVNGGKWTNSTYSPPSSLMKPLCSPGKIIRIIRAINSNGFQLQRENLLK